MDMSQYRELFLSETREHINNINKLVVTLEQQPANRETVDALFREAHSIKGMAATMGFDRTAQLSHHLEDLLAGFRATGAVPSSVIDYLLAGIDILDGLLDDLQANRPEREIASFMHGAPQEEALPVVEAFEGIPVNVIGDAAEDETLFELISATEADVNEALSEPPAEESLAGVPDLFQILVDLAEDTPAAAARGILILRELEKSGELLSSQPDLSALRSGIPCQQVQAWLRSPRPRADIENILRQISGVINVRFIDDRRNDDSQARKGKERSIRISTALLDQFVNLTGELITQRYMLDSAAKLRNWTDLTQTLSQTRRLIDDLHHHVLQARLMPLESITGRLPRIVRDLSRKTGKTITLQLKGADVGIDRAVLEGITDSLVHLVRNAVDHGIDNEGAIIVSAYREKDFVLIEVADNGRGMDPSLLRQKAVDSGLLTPLQASGLSDRDALMLVCKAGFSTAETITETSGRGVGLDVVSAAVSTLGGTLEITSEANQGTRFQMKLPLSFAIIKILLVSCSGHPLAIPITRVQRTLDLPTREIQSCGQKRVFRLDEEIIRLYSLPHVLGLPEVAAGETTWVVLTEVHGRRIGLQVDAFIGQREAFVKSIGFPMNLLPGLNGATIEGNGQIVFIVDPVSLLGDSFLENQQLN